MGKKMEMFFFPAIMPSTRAWISKESGWISDQDGYWVPQLRKGGKSDWEGTTDQTQKPQEELFFYLMCKGLVISIIN